MIMFTLIASIIIAVLGYGWWWHRHGGGKAAREQEAAESRRRGPRLQMHGWRYDPTHDGDIRYRVNGTSPGGIAWTVEYDCDHSSSSSSPRLTFIAPELAAEEDEWVLMDRWSFDISRKGVGGAMIGGVSALGVVFSKVFARRRDFYLNASERPVGTPALRERFVVIAESSLYDALIDADAEARILVWPPFKQSMSRLDNCLSAGCGEKGVQVKLYVDGPSVDVIEQVVRLGEALADATKRAAQG